MCPCSRWAKHPLPFQWCLDCPFWALPFAPFGTGSLPFYERRTQRSWCKPPCSHLFTVCMYFRALSKQLQCCTSLSCISTHLQLDSCTVSEFPFTHSTASPVSLELRHSLHGFLYTLCLWPVCCLMVSCTPQGCHTCMIAS